MKLQNNFTTPEQSQRLLELGLPQDSADCLCNSDGTSIIVRTRSKPELDTKKYMLWAIQHGLSLCWSVGRLIEIITICDTEEEWEPIFEPDDNILEMVFDFISVNYNNRLDFSKLED